MASYFWQDKQDERNEELAERAAAAHERRMRSRSRFIEGNPGAVSPQERAGVMQWQQNQGLTGRESALQQHEMDMLKQHGENDFRVAEQKRLGMKEQGSDAAEANGRWGLEIEKQRGASALTLEERRLAGQKDLAEIDAGVKKHEIDTRHKGILDTNDANVEIEDRRQKGALDVEKERGKSAAEIARDSRLTAAAEAERARQERLQATGNKNNQSQEDRIARMVSQLEKDPASRNLTPAQKRAKALELLGIDEEGTGGLSQFRK